MNSECNFVKRCWVEVDLGVLIGNLKAYEKSLQSPHEIMAVVKANAYGHGDVEVSKTLQQNGIRHFAVSNIEEAIRLRKAGITGQILILGYTPCDQAKRLLDNDITQAIVDEQYATELSNCGLRVKVQAALDTGMNRIGLDAEKPEDCERAIRQYANDFELTGLFTHLCVADTDTESCRAFTKRQEELFMTVAERVADLKLPFIHCLNSAGGLWHDCTASHLVRLGIILYGLKPDYLNKLPQGIKPVLEWKTVVSMVKHVHAGETIGYGRSFHVEKDMAVATLPTGYADGYNRLLSNKGRVFIHGHAAPIVGRVCMDQMLVNVTDIPNVKLGDEAVLLNRDTYTADDMAEELGTIGYEIVCDISERVTRVYI
jgi:alanine racemase